MSNRNIMTCIIALFQIAILSLCLTILFLHKENESLKRDLDISQKQTQLIKLLLENKNK